MQQVFLREEVPVEREAAQEPAINKIKLNFEHKDSLVIVIFFLIRSLFRGKKKRKHESSKKIITITRPSKSWSPTRRK